jgi:ribA/ribD-fused uncharacterized protein
VHDHTSFQILSALEDPDALKARGKLITGFNETVWQQVVCSVALAVTSWKFTHVPVFRQLVLRHGRPIFAEASPTDALWGIGVSADDSRALSLHAWPCANILGWALNWLADLHGHTIPVRCVISDDRQGHFYPHTEHCHSPAAALSHTRTSRLDLFEARQDRASTTWGTVSSRLCRHSFKSAAALSYCADATGCTHPGCSRCTHAATALMADRSTNAPFNSTPLSESEHEVIQLLHDK